jgi:hypothetical protein
MQAQPCFGWLQVSLAIVPRSAAQLLAQRCEAKSYRMLEHGRTATDLKSALISRPSGTMNTYHIRYLRKGIFTCDKAAIRRDRQELNNALAAFRGFNQCAIAGDTDQQPCKLKDINSGCSECSLDDALS